MTNEWDPLSLDSAINTDILASAKKREIKNILKSYVGFFDPFSELIQNAMDAVDRRSDSGETGYEKHISIEVNIDENSLVVTDNGVGFEQTQLKHFLAPNISFKTGSKTRGNKGVGATYLAYGFNYLGFETKSNGFTASGEIKEGRKWVEDTEGVIPRPLIQMNDSIKRLSNVDYGTSFLLIVGGEHSRPKNLSWVGATTAKQWKYLLLSKTPLGLIANGDSKSDIKFSIKVIHKGVIDVLLSQNAAYVYPHSEIPQSLRFGEIIQAQSDAVTKGKDVQQALQKFQKKNGLYEHFSKVELSDLAKEKELKDAIEKYHISAYGYFGYSTDIWDLLNDRIAELRMGYRFLRGGLQIANNNMIQGDPITIPLTSNIGYQNQCHIVIHLNGADPDLGRKGFQPEVRSACEKIAVVIVKRLKIWRKALKTNSGAAITTEKATRLHEWLRCQEEHETQNALTLLNRNFFKPTSDISIVSKPQSEQDVIVLFNQLIAGGVIRGVILLATSQSEQYDSVFRYVTKPPPTNYIFDEIDNPLGLDTVKASAPTRSRPYVLEYKYSLDGLMADFENGEKVAADIELAVAWEAGDLWRKDWEITSLLHFDNASQRDFHGLTHIMHNAGASIKLILLKDLIEYLNDSAKSQAEQNARYSEIEE